jgi:hypothetical protein
MPEGLALIAQDAAGGYHVALYNDVGAPKFNLKARSINAALDTARNHAEYL